jgi:hypothetical protein
MTTANVKPAKQATHGTRRITRRTATAAALSLPLSAASLFAASATPASAAAKSGFLGHYTVNGARIRSKPYLTGTIGGLGYTDQNACINVSDVPKHSGYYWNYNHDEATGINGWTAHSLIDDLYVTSYGSLIYCNW